PFSVCCALRALHSLPTRRSSDLPSQAQAPLLLPGIHRDTFALGGQSAEQDTGTVKYYRIPVSSGQRVHAAATVAAPPYADGIPEDRKSTRLNSSHVSISYAVFCL